MLRSCKYLTFFVIALLMSLASENAIASGVNLSVEIRERKAVDTINDFDYSQINQSSTEKIYI